MNNLLIVSAHAPYYTSHAQDAIEAALAASNVGLKVTVVFANNGVFQLLNEQDNKLLEKKSISKQIKVLPLYDINDIYFVEEDAQQCSLPTESLLKVAEPIDTNTYIDLCASSTAVLRF